MHRFCLWVIIAVSFGPTIGAAAEPRVPIIFDTDLGTDVDDAWALILAATHPRLDLRAVTVFRRPIDVRARLARKMLNDLGRDDVPVGKGAAQSLTGRPVLFGGWEGKGYLGEDEHPPGTIDESAADLIVRTLRQSDRPMTLVTVGGVTNLALAFQQAPESKALVERIVIMGGSVRPFRIDGQDLDPKLESNLGADPEAAKIVLESGIPITLVPAEVTFHAKLLKSDYERVLEQSSPLIKGLQAMTDMWAGGIKGFAMKHNLERHFADTVVLLHDSLAVFDLIEPDSLQREPTRIRVEIEGDTIRTVADPEGPIEVDLVTGAEMERLSRINADAVLTAPRRAR